MEQLIFNHKAQTVTGSLNLPETELQNLGDEVVEALNETDTRSEAMERIYNKYQKDPARLMLACLLMGEVVAKHHARTNPLAQMLSQMASAGDRG